MGHLYYSVHYKVNCIGNFEPNELGYAFSQETMERFVQLQNNLIEPMNFRYPHEQTVGNRKQLPPIEFLSQKNAISTTTSLSNTVENDKRMQKTMLVCLIKAN